MTITPLEIIKCGPIQKKRSVHRLFAVVPLAFIFLTGCQSMLKAPSLKQPNKVSQSDDGTDTDDSDEPSAIDKIVQIAKDLHSDETPDVLNSEGRDEYEQAVKLYEAKQYTEAEKEFKRIAKKFKHSTVREDAIFMKGECQFQQQKFSWAQDSYDELFEDFPSTRHVDVATRRLFHIAKTWLGQPDFATTENIKQVNLEDPAATPPPKKQKFPHSSPLRPNLFDRTRPVFDTSGRALQALKSIWLNDPTGPLADDALMLEATYYMRLGKNMEADRVFSILREEYPKSDHLQAAFVLGSHVKLMSYQGAAYDGKTLEEARQLKESTLRLFPNAPEAKRIRGELKNLTEANAQRDWEVVVFYRKKNKPKAMAIYCYEILKKYPETRYAKLAEETLVELGLERSPLAETNSDSDVFIPAPLNRSTETPQSEDRSQQSESETDTSPNPDTNSRPSLLPKFKPKLPKLLKLKPPRLFPFSKNEDGPAIKPIPRQVEEEKAGRVKL